jgi:hypothetical protein
MDCIKKSMKHNLPPIILNTIYEGNDEYECPPAPIDTVNKRKLNIKKLRSKPIILPIINEDIEYDCPPAPTIFSNKKFV